MDVSYTTSFTLGGVHPSTHVAHTRSLDAPPLALQAGRLRLKFKGVPAGLPPYWILRVDGNPETGYQRALVYTCTVGIKTLWLLSRDPNVSDSEVQEYLLWAQNHGVSLPSFDIFARTYNNVSECQSFWSSI